MGTLKALAALALLCSANPAAADPIDPWRPFIAEASSRFGVPESWIRRVMRAESGGRTILDGVPIRSRAGAIGLMQLMPRTWASLRDTWRLGPDPDDPHDNILAGAAYLRSMYDRFGYPGLFAAYNAGPERFAAYLAYGAALPAETRRYVATVAGAGASPVRAPSVASAGRTRPPFVRRPADTLFAIGGPAGSDRTPQVATPFVVKHG